MSAIQTNVQEVTSQLGSPARWAERHLAAWHSPVGFEIALKSMIVGLAYYGAEMRRQFETAPGADSFLGPAFRAIAASLVTLLNGDLGRFDGGTLDALVRAICVENGVELEE